MVRPKKSLGQHFLTSEAAVHHMVTASSITSKDTVLEIGPGKGVLTKALLSTGAHVIVVEKDDRMIPILSELFADEIQNKQLTIISGDILDTDISHITAKKEYKLVANIPYYITGEIMRFFLEHNHKPKSITILVQKEIAERIVAKNKKESILSLSVKLFGTPHYVTTVKKGSFFPIPNVDSAILYISDIHNNTQLTPDQHDAFFKLIHTGFAHKRKHLISNLSRVYSKQHILNAFKTLSIDEKIRAEDLVLSMWIQLCTIVHI
jgi:16S rRNA (adenine1518-N6/adenine1519-N6)-dimethyltransferase